MLSNKVLFVVAFVLPAARLSQSKLKPAEREAFDYDNDDNEDVEEEDTKRQPMGAD